METSKYTASPTLSLSASNARFMPYGTKTSLFAGTIQDFQWVGSWGYRPRLATRVSNHAKSASFSITHTSWAKARGALGDRARPLEYHGDELDYSLEFS